jgi:quercetin dioxygenase-like cupin family protein
VTEHRNDHQDQHQETCVGGALALPDLASALLTEARGHHSRRAANTILTGASMRATVIALAEGADMGEHEAPPAATLQVLSGKVELVAGTQRWALTAGQVIAIPRERHALHAGSDAVVLLTVALL